MPRERAIDDRRAIARYTRPVRPRAEDGWNLQVDYRRRVDEGVLQQDGMTVAGQLRDGFGRVRQGNVRPVGAGGGTGAESSATDAWWRSRRERRARWR